MKKHILTLMLTAFLFVGFSQTIVKMNVPKQSKEPVKVVVLFDEPVPEGMPVVLGLMGYTVTGGVEPYTYEWVQNGTVIGTGDIVVITPQKGDRFELKATDKNRCYSVSSFTMKVIPRMKVTDKQAGEYKVYPTLVKNEQIHIELPRLEKPLQAFIRIFDMKGAVKHSEFIDGSSTVHCTLPDGAYFVSVKTDDFQKVEKIIVQH